MIGKLYLLTNKINGKQYVGKTYRTLEARFKQHISESKTSNRPICRAIAKYGSDNFNLELLGEYDNLENEEELAIAKFDSYKNGYNATLGGDGKKTVNIPIETIVEAYNRLGSIRACALELEGIGATSIKNKLNDLGVNTSVSKRYYKPIAIVELNKKFLTIKECANFLEALIPYSSKTISTGIARALKTDKAGYKGYTFELL